MALRSNASAEQAGPKLEAGALVKMQGRAWRVGLVNDCRARLDPVGGFVMVSPVNGRTFQSYGTSVNVSPHAVLERVDEATLTSGERLRMLTLVERELEEAVMGAVAAVPVDEKAGKKANKNTAANEERLAKLADIKAKKAAEKAANPPKAKAEKAVKPCKCGCGGQTTAFFIPGHDAKFKSMLLKIERGKAKPEELLTEAVRTSYKWKKTADGKGLIPTTDYKGNAWAGFEQSA